MLNDSGGKGVYVLLDSQKKTWYLKPMSDSQVGEGVHEDISPTILCEVTKGVSSCLISGPHYEKTRFLPMPQQHS